MLLLNRYRTRQVVNFMGAYLGWHPDSRHCGVGFVSHSI